MTIAQRAIVIAFLSAVAVAVVMLGSVIGYLIGGPELTLYCGENCVGMVFLRCMFGIVAAVAAGLLSTSETIQSFKGGTK